MHDIQLNGWVLAYRRHVGEALLRWEGETDIEPPQHTRAHQLRLDDNWSAEGLRDPKPRLLRPDALLELRRRDGGTHGFLIEHDRTRRVDKNYDKFRRYDAFLCWLGGGATTQPGPTAPKRRSCCSSAKTRTNATCSSPPPTAN